MSNEHRRNHRLAINHMVEVSNAITEQVIGRIGNVSADGLMLIGHRPIRDDALYQFSFTFPPDRPGARRIEIGVHEQWNEPASVHGQYWAGFRIIDIAADDRTTLVQWLQRQG